VAVDAQPVAAVTEMDPDPPSAPKDVVVDALATEHGVGVGVGVVSVLVPHAGANSNATAVRSARVRPEKCVATIMNSSCAGRPQPEIRSLDRPGNRRIHEVELLSFSARVRASLRPPTSTTRRGC